MHGFVSMLTCRFLLQTSYEPITDIFRDHVSSNAQFPSSSVSVLVPIPLLSSYIEFSRIHGCVKSWLLQLWRSVLWYESLGLVVWFDFMRPTIHPLSSEALHLKNWASIYKNTTNSSQNQSFCSFHSFVEHFSNNFFLFFQFPVYMKIPPDETTKKHQIIKNNNKKCSSFNFSHNLERKTLNLIFSFHK